MNMSDSEQPVRLVLQSHSFSGSEPKKIHCNYFNDQEEIIVTRRTPYKSRAAVFVTKK